MEWLVVTSALVFVIVVACGCPPRTVQKAARAAGRDHGRRLLDRYFALDEFNDEELRERIEHLRGVPELR